jgi:hypothetical protein
MQAMVQVLTPVQMTLRTIHLPIGQTFGLISSQRRKTAMVADLPPADQMIPRRQRMTR